jgi:hypothetical protein
VGSEAERQREVSQHAGAPLSGGAIPLGSEETKTDGPGGGTQQVSWVYRRGDEVWVYRWQGDGAPDVAADTSARLREMIEASKAPLAEPPLLAIRPTFRWSWILLGVLTGFLLGVLFTEVLRPLMGGRIHPMSMVGFGGVLLGIVSTGELPPRWPWPLRRTALVLWVGLVVFTGTWFTVGLPAVGGDAARFVTFASLLSHTVGLICMLLAVTWVYQALDTTIVPEAAPLIGVFTGTLSVSVAILLFLHGSGQPLASADLDLLVVTILALAVCAANFTLIGGLLLGGQVRRLAPALGWTLGALLLVAVVQFVIDFTGSVTVALFSTHRTFLELYAVLAQDARLVFIAVVDTLVVYVWAMAILLLPLGRSLVRRRDAPAADVQTRVDELALHWPAERPPGGA